MGEDLSRRLVSVKFVVHAIYSSVIIYAGLVLVGIRVGPPGQPQLFLPLLGVALTLLPVSFFLSSQVMSAEVLQQRYKEGGLDGMAGAIRVGATVLSALGEANGIFGLVLYFTSRDQVRPFVFFALAAAHYGLTLWRVSAAAVEADLVLRRQPHGQ